MNPIGVTRELKFLKEYYYRDLVIGFKEVCFNFPHNLGELGSETGNCLVVVRHFLASQYVYLSSAVTRFFFIVFNTQSSGFAGFPSNALRSRLN